jgi:hypothetical protein
MTDSQMIDWLEAYINEYGSILLHDGNAKPCGHPGLGLRPGSLYRRTLREAIAQAAGNASKEAK